MGYDCSAKKRVVCYKLPYCYGIYQYPSVFYKTCHPPAAIIPRCDTDWMINHKYEKCSQYKVVDKDEDESKKPMSVVKQVIYDTIEETAWISRLERKCTLYKKTCSGYCPLCCLTSLFETETVEGVRTKEQPDYYKHCVYYSVQLLYDVSLDEITSDKKFPPNVLRKYLNPPDPFFLCRRETDYVVYHLKCTLTLTLNDESEDKNSKNKLQMPKDVISILEKYIYPPEPILGCCIQKLFLIYHFKSPIINPQQFFVSENMSEQQYGGPPITDQQCMDIPMVSQQYFPEMAPPSNHSDEVELPMNGQFNVDVSAGSRYLAPDTPMNSFYVEEMQRNDQVFVNNNMVVQSNGNEILPLNFQPNLYEPTSQCIPNNQLYARDTQVINQHQYAEAVLNSDVSAENTLPSIYQPNLCGPEHQFNSQDIQGNNQVLAQDYNIVENQQYASVIPSGETAVDCVDLSYKPNIFAESLPQCLPNNQLYSSFIPSGDAVESVNVMHAPLNYQQNVFVEPFLQSLPTNQLCSSVIPIEEIADECVNVNQAPFNYQQNVFSEPLLQCLPENQLCSSVIPIADIANECVNVNQAPFNYQQNVFSEPLLQCLPQNQLCSSVIPIGEIIDERVNVNQASVNYQQNIFAESLPQCLQKNELYSPVILPGETAGECLNVNQQPDLNYQQNIFAEPLPTNQLCIHDIQNGIERFANQYQKVDQQQYLNREPGSDFTAELTNNLYPAHNNRDFQIISHECPPFKAMTGSKISYLPPCDPVFNENLDEIEASRQGYCPMEGDKILLELPQQEYDKEINRLRNETEEIIENECEKYLKLLNFNTEDEPLDKLTSHNHHTKTRMLRNEETQKSVWINIQDNDCKINIKQAKNKITLRKPDIIRVEKGTNKVKQYTKSAKDPETKTKEYEDIKKSPINKTKKQNDKKISNKSSESYLLSTEATEDNQVQNILEVQLDLDKDISKSQELYCSEMFKKESNEGETIIQENKTLANE